MGFVLLIISLVFTSIFTLLWIPIAVVYHLATFKWLTGAKEVNKYFYQLAIIVDVFANESLATLFNYIMVKRKEDFFKFGGDDRDTISYVFAVNYLRGTLSRFGKWWAVKFLDNIDKGHLKKAIKNKEERYTRFLEGYTKS